MIPVDLSYEEFCRTFQSEVACSEALASLKWPHGFRCPVCSHHSAYTIRSRKSPLYQCRFCGHQTSLTAGTIMEGTRTPLSKWFQAIYWMSRGISSFRLSKIIRVTYKTAWLMTHKVRHAISQFDIGDRLSGSVRLQAAIYGMHSFPSVSCLYKHEHPLLAGASLDHEGKLTHIKLKQIVKTPRMQRYNFTEFSANFKSRHVNQGHTSFIGELNRFSKNKFPPLDAWCQSAFRWLNKTYSGIGAKHLQVYLDEVCFRYNATRVAEHIAIQLTELCASTNTITYPELVHRPNDKVPYTKSA